MTSFLALEAARLAQHGARDRGRHHVATAELTGATLWTQDIDFEGFPGVRYIPKVQV